MRRSRRRSENSKGCLVAFHVAKSFPYDDIFYLIVTIAVNAQIDEAAAQIAQIIFAYLSGRHERRDAITL
jgi:hypothetical protein